MIHPTASIHPSARIGANARIRRYARIGEYADIGASSDIGEYADIGGYARIRASAVITARAISFGHQDGYTRTLCWTPDGVYVTSGCWTGTIDETEKHWRTHEEDRRLSLCLIPAMRAAAELYKE